MGGILLLLICQLIGEVVVSLTHLPVPGPVVGMLLLLGILLATGGPSPGLERVAQGLLKHLSLFFVPAGAGVVAYLSLIGREWLPLSAALVGSTALTMALTAWTTQTLMRYRLGPEKEEKTAPWST